MDKKAIPGSGAVLAEEAQRGGRRLAIALLASCLLHASAFLLIDLGGGEPPDGQVSAVAKIELPRVPAVTVTLLFPLPRAPTPDLPGETDFASPKPKVAEKNSSATADGGMGILPLPGPTYYDPTLLSKQPLPITPVDLDTPEIRPIIASGKMLLKLWINESGEVVNVELEESDLPEQFSEVAKMAFRKLRLQPGERSGVPVNTVIRIEVQYDDGRTPAKK
jgi:TonB family protein